VGLWIHQGKENKGDSRAGIETDGAFMTPKIQRQNFLALPPAAGNIISITEKYMCVFV